MRPEEEGGGMPYLGTLPRPSSGPESVGGVFKGGWEKKRVIKLGLNNWGEKEIGTCDEKKGVEDFD